MLSSALSIHILSVPVHFGIVRPGIAEPNTCEVRHKQIKHTRLPYPFYLLSRLNPAAAPDSSGPTLLPAPTASTDRLLGGGDALPTGLTLVTSFTISTCRFHPAGPLRPPPRRTLSRPPRGPGSSILGVAWDVPWGRFETAPVDLFSTPPQPPGPLPKAPAEVEWKPAGACQIVIYFTI